MNLPRLASLIMIAGAWLGHAKPSSAAEAEDARAATVGVGAVRDGKMVRTGFGVVALTRDGSGFVVTCESAIASNAFTREIQTGEVRVRPGQAIGDPKVILFDGAKQTAVGAKLLARDSRRNLAVLAFPCPQGQVSLSPFGKFPQLSETDRAELIVAGDGGELKSESVEITALRQAGGQLVSLQLGRELAAGWTGAPLVGAAGQLLGLASASLDGAGISFATSATEIADLLDGSIGEPAVRVVNHEAQGIQLEVEVPLLDPLGRIADLQFLLGLDGKSPQTIPLKRSQGAARATIRVDRKTAVIVKGNYSVHYTLATGKPQQTPTHELEIDFEHRKARAAINPLRKFGFDRRLVRIDDDLVPSPLVTGFEIERFADRFANALRRIDEGDSDEKRTPHEQGVFFSLQDKILSKILLNDATGAGDAAAGGREIARLYLPHTFNWIVRCSDGLAAHSRELNQLWLIDPESLKVNKRIAIAIQGSGALGKIGLPGIVVRSAGNFVYIDLQTLRLTAATPGQLRERSR